MTYAKCNVLILAVTLLSACSETIPVAPNLSTDSESLEQTLSAKPSCPDHPGCKNNGGGSTASGTIDMPFGDPENGIVSDGPQTVSVVADNATRLELNSGGSLTAIATRIAFDETFAVADAALDDSNPSNPHFNPVDSQEVCRLEAGRKTSVDDVRNLLQELLSSMQGRGLTLKVDRTAGSAASDGNMVSHTFEDATSGLGNYNVRIGTAASVFPEAGSPAVSTTSNADGTTTYRFEGGAIVAESLVGKSRDHFTVACVNQGDFVVANVDLQ